MDAAATVGYAGAALSVASSAPQVLRVLTTASDRGVSLGSWLAMTCSALTWTVYGVAVDSWPQILGNGIAAAAFGAVVAALVVRAGVRVGRRWLPAALWAVLAGVVLATAGAAALGWAATALTTLVRLPQLWLTLRDRRRSALAVSSWVISAAAGALWVGYGLLAGDWPVTVTSAWSTVVALAVCTVAATARYPAPRPGPVAAGTANCAPPQDGDAQSEGSRSGVG